MPSQKKKHRQNRRRTSSSNYVWEIKKNLGTDHVLKCRKYKSGNRYCNLCIEEKLALASHSNPNELPKEMSEILNVFRHKNFGCLVNKV